MAVQIQDAVDAWTAATDQAGALPLDLKVNDASLDVGMSPGQVQSAMSQARDDGCHRVLQQGGAGQ